MDNSLSQSYDITYNHFYKRLIKTDMFIAIVCFTIEILFLPYFCIYGPDTISYKEYIIKYLAIPSIINSLILVIGNLIINKTKIKEENKRLIPIIILIFILGIIIYIHCTFSTLYLTFIVPILLSTIYGESKSERYILTLSLLVMTIVFISCGIFKKDDVPQNYAYNITITYAVILLSHLLARIMIKYEKQKEIILAKNVSYNKLLELEATTDGLTKLNNHTALFNYLNKIDKNNKTVVTMIDIDLFKSINDKYGHETGNIVLQKLGEILKKYESENIFPARYGGEEFSIIFTNYELDTAAKLVDTIRKELCETQFNEIKDNPITFSAGVAQYNNEPSIGAFLEKADTALYEAKASGRNNVKKFTN